MWIVAVIGIAVLIYVEYAVVKGIIERRKK